MADPELNADGTPKDTPPEPAPDSKGAAPAIDMDALGEIMGKKVKEGVAEALSQVNPGPRPQQAEMGRPAQDPLGDMVRGYVDGDLRATRLAVEDAKDFGTFYAKGDEDEREWKRENTSQIEDIFGKMVKAGRPMSREDIAQWVKGKEPDKFVEFKSTRQKRRLDQIAGSQSGLEQGSSAPRGVPAGKDPFELSEDELNKTTAGKWF